MSTTTIRPVFTDTELPSEESINPFRPSGLVSMFFGVISASALASTSLLIIPLLGLMIGLFALRPPRDPKLKPGGRIFAVLGIGLSLLFASWSWAYYNAQKNFMVSEGTRFALNWLEILQDGHIEFAFELTQPKSARQLDTMPLSQFYKPENQMPYEMFQAFESGALVQAVVNASQKPNWKFTQVIDQYSRYKQEHIVLAFEDTSGAVRPILVTLSCVPPLDSFGKPVPNEPYQWHVSDTAIGEEKVSGTVSGE